MIIFSPGPSNISDRVRSALMRPDIGHRDEAFTQLMVTVRAGLLEVAGLSGSDYRVTLLSGSGTAGIDAVVSACRPLGKLLVVANGAYGERAAAIARYHAVDVAEWRLAWGEEIDVTRLAAQVAEHAPAAVYVIHHETSTGRLNDLAAIAHCVRASGALMLADCISSFAGETLDPLGWGVDAFIGSSNKCLRGVPGVAFVVANERFITRVLPHATAHYCDLATHLKAEEAGETPFTPAIQAMFALQEAIAETLDEGVANRLAHYRRKAGVLTEGFAALSLRLYLPRAAYGHNLFSYELPAGVSFSYLRDALKARDCLIYAAQGPLKDRLFRIGLVGHFGEAEVQRLVDEMAALVPVV